MESCSCRFYSAKFIGRKKSDIYFLALNYLSEFIQNDFGCKEAKEYAKEYAENARMNSLLEFVRNLMANMKLGAEQAMNLLGVNDSDREILQKRL